MSEPWVAVAGEAAATQQAQQQAFLQHDLMPMLQKLAVQYLAEPIFWCVIGIVVGSATVALFRALSVLHRFRLFRKPRRENHHAGKFTEVFERWQDRLRLTAMVAGGSYALILQLVFLSVPLAQRVVLAFMLAGVAGWATPTGYDYIRKRASTWRKDRGIGGGDDGPGNDDDHTMIGG